MRALVRWGVSLVAAVAWVGCFASFANAHPLDVAYFDISQDTTGTTLTVAVHPYQAFELVRGGSKKPFDLNLLRAKGELVTAYVADHVQLSDQDAAPCVWDPEDAHVPASELEAVADGVTIAGVVRCPSVPKKLNVWSDLFIDGFPTQTNIIRLDLPDGFAERGTLTKTTMVLAVDLAELQTSVQAPSISKATSTSVVRTPDAKAARLAQQLLDPGVSWLGMIGILLSVALVGALHALGPGHGKSLMAAALVGEKATIGRAVTLGTVMTVTHVSDVFLMALIAGSISAFLPPLTLLRYLEIFSAAGLIFLGLANLIRALLRYRLVRNNPQAVLDDEAHARAHALGLPHAHHEEEARPDDHSHEAQSFRRALWLGFVGSLAPCPTAWAIFMATLSAGRPGMGAALLVSFTIGLHVTILAIGMLLVVSTKFAVRRTPPKFTYFLPIVSAALIMALGSYLFIAKFR